TREENLVLLSKGVVDLHVDLCALSEGEAFGARLGGDVGELARGHGLPGQWRRLQRVGLRGGSLLARNVALRRRALVNRKERLAGLAIEHEQESLLGNLRHGRNRFSSTLHLYQEWCRG